MNTLNTAPIQSAELAELRKLAEAATPGPWHIVYGDDRSYMCMTAVTANPQRKRNEGPFGDHENLVAVTYHQTYPVVDTDIEDDCGDANSAFIAAANPATILRLLAALAAQAPAQQASIETLAAFQAECAAATKALKDSDAALAAQEHAKPTDISTRLRKMAASPFAAAHSEITEVMLTAASECERFYGGMVAWKETAQQKDRNIAEHYVRKDRAAPEVKPTDLQAVPDGWKLVPVEPTPEMLDAAGQALSKNGAEGNVLELQGDAHVAYAAMLAAAPTPPAAREYPAVMLTRMGHTEMCEVSLCIDKRWIVVLQDNGTNISHIVEPLGIRRAIERALSGNTAAKGE